MEKCYNFEVAHGYEILKGYVYAASKEKAIEMIKDEDWDDVIDVYESAVFEEDYDIVDIWEDQETTLL